MSQVKRVFQHDSKPVSAGAILTYDIPVFETIDDILIKALNSGAPATLANFKAAFGKIALSINGEQVVNVPLERLCDVYSSLGNEVSQNLVNVIGLNIARYLFKDPVIEDYFSYGTNNIQTIQLQVYCNSSVTGVTDLAVSTVRRKIEQPLGAFLKIIDYPQSMSSTGTSVVDTLPRNDSREAYLCVLAHNGGGVISQGECVVNGNSIFDPMTQGENDYIVGARGLAAVSGVFNYSFSDGSIKGILPMAGVTELRLKTTFTTAPTNSTYDLVAVTIRNVPDAMLAAVSA